MKAILFLFSGLPATGKTTLAKALAQKYNAVYLRIDTVEQGLRDLCHYRVEGEGYRLSYRLAAENLHLGNHVVADGCNPILLTRKEWQETALQCGARYVNIEVVCSDKTEHRLRVENRTTDIANLSLPTWEEVEKREYHAWDEEVLLIDTACRPITDSVNELYTKVEAYLQELPKL
ncbi:AAA family ATPase [Tannerella sp.]|uniref:AAA family ATPase n=1 Tax=Tannerella sp. TaxID=2382127 RepID=UPI0026DA8034|nr:AAA family ATPase [Tannerella sp.]MDO4703570.1 AAA family ATPase [Tannerella sp.]